MPALDESPDAADPGHRTVAHPELAKLYNTLTNQGGTLALPGAPRGELGYAERQTSDTTTNTTFGNISSNLISTLSLSVTGAGRAVEIEVGGSIYHSVASTYVGIGIVMDGSTIAYGGTSSPSTSVGRSVLVKARKVLVSGQSYTFTVGKYVGAAGTGTYYADALGSPTYLSVAER